MIIIAYGKNSQDTLDALVDRLKAKCDCHAHVAGVVVKLTHDDEMDDMVFQAVTDNVTNQLGETFKKYHSREAAVKGAVAWIDEQIRLLQEHRSLLV